MRYHAISLLVLSAAISSASPLLLNSKATYLRTNGDGSAIAATAYKLSDLGLSAGDEVKFTRVGSFNNGNGLFRFGLTAVFSSTSTLLGASNLNRVPDAIDAGLDVVTPNTFIGNLSTDIAEDFEISNADGTVSHAIVDVPTGAEYIFFSGRDSYFGDNSSQDFGVEIEAVPEPGTIAALGLGLAALKRRRSK